MTREKRLREIQAELDATYQLKVEAEAHMRELLIKLHNEFPEEFRAMQSRFTDEE
jgi:hypothetical protein